MHRVRTFTVASPADRRSGAIILMMTILVIGQQMGRTTPATPQVRYISVVPILSDFLAVGDFIYVKWDEGYRITGLVYGAKSGVNVWAVVISK